jgi:hypothetical protein
VNQLNTRDQQIAEVKKRVEGLDADRLRHCYAEVIKAYEAASIVDSLAAVKEVTDRKPGDFRVITNQEARAWREFKDPSTVWDLFCSGLGRSIALGEEGYIFEKLAQIAPSGVPINLSAPDFSSIREAVEVLRQRGFKPDSLIAPIDFFVPFNLDQRMQVNWDSSPREVLVDDGWSLMLFWSSNATPIDKFVVFDHRAGRWTVKLDPKTHHRLTVAIGEQTRFPRSVMFLAETVAKYEIVDQEGFVSIPVSGAASPHVDATSQDTLKGEG